MKRFMLFAFLVLIPLACSTQTSNQSAAQPTPKDEETPEVTTPSKDKQGKTTGEADWVQLFNGKDLTGWKTHPDAPGNWSVQGNVLVGNSPTLSFLYSERDDFDNFHVRMEAKVSEKCDSGLFFRAQYPGTEAAAKKGGKKGDPGDPTAKKGAGGGKGKGPGNPKGYEAQINNTVVEGKGKGGAGGSLTGSLLIGAGGGKGNNVSEHLVNPPDDWFTLEVIADGPRIKIQVNGKQTVDYNSSSATTSFSKGHFAIQSKAPGFDKGGAGGKAAGKKGGAAPGEQKTYDQIIYIRKLEIKELPSVAGK